jgi:hypothetical protein
MSQPASSDMPQPLVGEKEMRWMNEAVPRIVRVLEETHALLEAMLTYHKEHAEHKGPLPDSWFEEYHRQRKIR